MTTDLGRIGIWSPTFLWHGSDAGESVAELAELGYGALWLGGSEPDLRLHQQLLDAAERITIAAAIVSVFTSEATSVAEAYHRLADAHGGRFVLGLGVSHGEIVSRQGGVYERPLAAMRGYLDQLDAAPRPVPPARRVLAALGPRALRPAAERSAGAHPYLTTPTHTAAARELLGAGPLLVPDQKVVLDADPATARSTARSNLSYYLQLPNYRASLARLGFDEDELAGGGSDRVIDALYAWGDRDRVFERVQAHLDAGADHVAVQVLTGGFDIRTQTGALPLTAWRQLAPALLT